MTDKSTDRLRRELEEARAIRYPAPGSSLLDVDIDSADEKLFSCERDLAKAEGRPYAVPHPIDLSWCMGAPTPTLLQLEYQTVLLFYLEDSQSTSGVVEFDNCRATRFGLPDENSILYHSLSGSGLDTAPLHRVVNSSWTAELKAMELQVDQAPFSGHSGDKLVSCEHFIFQFHDSTFECLANGFSTKIVAGSPLKVLQKILLEI